MRFSAAPALLAAALAAAPAARAQVDPADEAGWSRPFSPVIVYGAEHAAALPDGRLFFVHRNLIPSDASRFFEWDGRRYHERIATGDNFFYSLTALPSGRVYASRYRDGIVEWNGTAFVPASPNDLPAARTFTGPGGTLCAVGTYTGSGRVPDVKCLENGAWRWLGLPEMQPMAARTAPDGSLYVLGWHGTQQAAHVVRYAGGAWTPLPTPPSPDARPEAVNVAFDGSGRVFVVTRGEMSALYRHRLWRLDGGGAAWTEIATPASFGSSIASANGGRVYGVVYPASSPGVVPGLVRVEGAALASAATGQGRDVALQTAPDGALLLSALSMSGFGNVTGSVLRYDGQAFRPFGDGLLGDGVPNFNVLAARPDGSVCVGGDVRNAGGLQPPPGGGEQWGVACWTGARWDTLAARIPTSRNVQEVHSLASDAQGNLYATATVENGPNNASASAAFRYDGRAWTRLGGFFSIPGQVVLGPDGSVYAFGPMSGAASLVQRWDGAAWQPVGALQGSAATGIVTTDGVVWATGSFTGFTGPFPPPLVRWSGAAWEPAPAPEPPGAPLAPQFSIRKMEAGPGGSLLLLGTRITYNAQYQQTRLEGVVRYAGGAWSQLGAGAPPFSLTHANALAADARGNVFVAGSGPLAAGGTNNVNTVYRFDSQAGTWRPLTARFDQPVTAMLYHNGTLSVAGEFTAVGPSALPVQGFAQWTDPTAVATEDVPPAPEGSGLGVRLAPNPARGPVALSFTLGAAETVRASVHDVLGREVMRLHDGPLPAGDARLALFADGLAPGVYLVRVAAGRTVQTRPLVVAR